MERRSCCEPWGGPELSDGRWAGEVAAVGFQRRRRGPEPETCVDGGAQAEQQHMCLRGATFPDRPCSSLPQFPSQRGVFRRPHHVLERCPVVLLGTVQCPGPASVFMVPSRDCLSEPAHS